jgi:hypothetical protein
MKKFLPFLTILAVMLMACSISVNVTPPPASPVPPATETLVTETPTVPVPTTVPSVTETPTVPVPTTIPANVICNKLSLYLDPALGSGYNCQTIPESSGADLPYFAINPQYTEVTFQGYSLADTFFPAHIDIFPVQRFRELVPDVMNERLPALQTLIAGGTPGSSALPLLPIENAAQVFYCQAAVIQFQSGSGIRFLTEYAQYYAPVNNHDMFYSVQGLTSDGQYWISATLPVSSPILPEDGTNPPGGQTWENFTNNYDSYKTDIIAQLNAQTPGSFMPTLTMLDALINSIIVQP